jgi:hypothetical protein
MMGSIGLKSARNVRGTIRPVVALLAVLMLVIGAMAAFMARLGEEIVRVTEQVTVGGTTVTITVTAPPPKPPDWILGIRETLAPINRFATERGMRIADDVWISLENELALSVWFDVIKTENEALSVSLIWLGISILEGSKRNIQILDSGLLYAIWYNIIALDISPRHPPHRSFINAILNKKEYWLERYPDLKILLKG